MMGLIRNIGYGVKERFVQLIFIQGIVFLSVFCMFSSTSIAQLNNQDARPEADLEDLIELDIEELAEIKIQKASIATGIEQTLAEAPAVLTVISAEDIKAIGATDLDEVLETVPGLHVSRDFKAYNPIYSFRGIYTLKNAQMLMMVNGIPITSMAEGNRSDVWGGMPVGAIERIEVIRGPGSAVYGAEALAGVINIVTKTEQDIDGTEVGGRAGNHRTRDGWLFNGGIYGGFETALMLQYRDTNGHDEFFEDLNNPGSVNLQRRNFDARLDVAREHWRLRGGLQRWRNMGTGLGIFGLLDDNGRFTSDRWNVDLTYHNPEVAESWNVKAWVSYQDMSQEVDDDVFRFTNLNSPSESQIDNQELFERHVRFEASALYKGFENHNLRFGAGLHRGEIYKTREEKGPPGNVEEVTNPRDLFLPETDRDNYYAYVQDLWHFAEQWELTAGVRYDRFSIESDELCENEMLINEKFVCTEFVTEGNNWTTVNPRLALVWSPREDLKTKLLYGRAFRAASASELFAGEFSSTGVVQGSGSAVGGNPDLDPETIDMVELAFDYQPTDALRFKLNLYKYWWRDYIALRGEDDPSREVPFVLKTENADDQTSYGLELESQWQVTPKLRLSGNYAYVNTDSDQDDFLAQAATNPSILFIIATPAPSYHPEHKVYLQADWRFLPAWHLNAQLSWVDSRKRPDAVDKGLDTKNPFQKVDDYTIVNMTVRRKDPKYDWEVAFSARNLLDDNAREPNAFIFNGDDNLPLAGSTTWYVELRFPF